MGSEVTEKFKVHLEYEFDSEEEAEEFARKADALRGSND